MTAWRRYLHAHPETAFAEHGTAAFVAQHLRSFGLDVHTGIAGTGVVATLATGEGPAIALRADMDALPIAERGTGDHRSRHQGRMHACGHDGHMAMLLGAARHLAETRSFRGTVRFVFQPAEENEGGGRAMVEDGLFRRFPVDAVFGMHNWPGLDVGRFAVRAGPMMAACDNFEIALTGRGTHAAMPHLGRDPIVAAAAVIGALQTFASRRVDPLDSAVVSVTRIAGGDTWNVLPERAVVAGTVRALVPATRDAAEAFVRETAAAVARAYGVEADVRYDQRYPATVNDARQAERAARVAARLVGDANVDVGVAPSMGSEDFSFMLNERPGCYIWIGNGSAAGGRTLHSPDYDFNDAILPLGAAYWVALVKDLLAADAAPGG
jgi:hippurate hydrolase